MAADLLGVTVVAAEGGRGSVVWAVAGSESVVVGGMAVALRARVGTSSRGALSCSPFCCSTLSFSALNCSAFCCSARESGVLVGVSKPVVISGFCD